ncbi:MAG: sugar ABC transporter substrate-binding protein [Inquilinus sp.]|nr:sugar ABC transporter substrate-binding protein [Inquilinus sp.]
MLKRLMLTAAIAAVAGTAQAQTEVSVWFHSGKGEEREVINAQVEDFNAMQDAVRVNLVLLPEGSYNDQVNAAALARDLPDLLDFDGPYIANYVWSGFLQPLDDLVDPALVEDLLPSIVAQGTYPGDGKLYSIGVFDSGLSLWGNRALLAKAGVDYPTGVDEAWGLAEFEDALAKLAALDEVEWPLDLKLNYGQGEWYTYGFSPIIQSMGGDLIDREEWRARGALDGPAAVAGMKALQSWVQKGWVVPAAAGDTNFFGEQTVGLALVGHWMYGPHTEGLGDDAVLIPMPKFGPVHATGMGSWNWGLTTNADNPEAAVAFLEYLMEPEQVLRMTSANGAVPARKSAIAMSDLFGEGGRLSLYTEQLNAIAVARPFHPAYPIISSAFAEAANNVIAGGDVAEELSRAARRIDEDIEDNAGYPPFGG